MPLRFKLDENLPDRLFHTLRDRGFGAETAITEGLSGARDSVILAASIAEDRVLITLDLDFADLRAYAPGSHRGIWVLRPSQQTFSAQVALVDAGIRLASKEQTTGRLWIIDERRVRIRA